MTTLLLGLGLTPEQLLDFFYNKINYAYDAKRDGWRIAFDPERLRGVRPGTDLVNAKTGKVAIEAGTKVSPRLARKLHGEGLRELLVQDEAVYGRYLAEDLIDGTSGIVIGEAGDEVGPELLAALRENKIKTLPTLDIDHITVGAYIRNTLAADRSSSREQALIEIYRRYWELQNS